MLSLICPWHCSHRGTETGAACFSYSLKLQTYIRWSVEENSSSPAPKMRTFADSSQAGKTSLESCCSVLSAHGTTRTEAQRLGLLACLATSNFKRILGGPCRGPPAALLRKCERLQIAGRQKGLTWKGVVQPHLLTTLLHGGPETGAACLSSNLKLQR